MKVGAVAHWQLITFPHSLAAPLALAGLGLDEFTVEEGLAEFLGERWFVCQPQYPLDVVAERRAKGVSPPAVDIYNPYALRVEQEVIPKITRARLPEGGKHVVQPSWPETMEEVRQRYLRTVKQLARKHVDSNIVLVTHGCV